MGAECRAGKVGLGWLGPDSAQRPGTQEARRALGPRSNRCSPPTHTHTARRLASPGTAECGRKARAAFLS